MPMAETGRGPHLALPLFFVRAYALLCKMEWEDIMGNRTSLFQPIGHARLKGSVVTDKWIVRRLWPLKLAEKNRAEFWTTKT